MTQGFLLIDKPTGMTSFQVLRTVDRRFGLTRAGLRLGHGGTLDPDASGLLVAAVGRATKLLRFFLGSDKRYRAEFRLGTRTTTDDATGDPVETLPWQHLTRDDIEGALARFRGTISQVPPDFSAIHVGGKRAYALARSGQPIALAPRDVTIHHIALTHADPPASPVIGLDIACSGGTYIRAIARDLGRALGTAAHMCALRRTQSCRFDLSRARSLDDIQNADAIDALLMPCADAMRHLPAVVLPPARAADLMRGRPVRFDTLPPGAHAVFARGEADLLAVVEIGEKVEITRIRTDA